MSNTRVKTERYNPRASTWERFRTLRTPRQLKHGDHISYAGKYYVFDKYDEDNPDIMRVKNLGTSQEEELSCSELSLMVRYPLHAPVYAPTLDGLKAELKRKFPAPPGMPEDSSGRGKR